MPFIFDVSRLFRVLNIESDPTGCAVKILLQDVQFGMNGEINSQVHHIFVNLASRGQLEEQEEKMDVDEDPHEFEMEH